MDNDNENVLKELQTQENSVSRISILLIQREIISEFYKFKRAFQYEHIMTFALQNVLHTRMCTDSVDSKDE